MEVVIVGAGAVGLLIGSYLAETGADVSFVTRRKEQTEALQKYGVTRKMNNNSAAVPVAVFDNISSAPRNAIWILAVKSNDVSLVIEQLEKGKQPLYVLFVQNGLRHFELAGSSSIPSLGFASITHGAGKVNDCTVYHRGTGRMAVAHFKGDESEMHQLLGSGSDAFPIEQEKDAYCMLLKKAIINCCINPLTALLQLHNGELLKIPSAHLLMKNVYNELIGVYPEMTRSVPFSDVEAVCEQTAENQSSMLTDRLAGNAMEIDSIVTAVLAQRRQEMPTLALLERLLTAMDERKDLA